MIENVEIHDTLFNQENERDLISKEKTLFDSFNKNDFSNHLYTERIQRKKEADQNAHFLSVEKLHLPFRITHSLLENHLYTIADLLNYSPKELQNFCGIGNFSLSLIQKKLKKMGLFLKTEKEI